MKTYSKLLFCFYAAVSFLLFLYSYTQIDLSLTLTQVSVWQSIQRWFQYVGYFHRPLSVSIYLAIISSLFILYGVVLFLVRKKRLNRKDIWRMVGIVTVITVLSYPAFSYDFFNYLFTAKTVLLYHKNPYIVIPLQFSGVEPWLSFMHWTHLPSAYTPLWILTTLLPYMMGFGYLLFLIWTLKLYIAAAYLVTSYGIGQILEDESQKDPVMGIAVFALNPLIIVECLISPHNDIVMMALAVWAIVVYKKRHYWLSWILLSLSVAMKLMTIFLIPSFVKKWDKWLALSGMLIGLTIVLFQRDILSWYWVWIMPFIALLSEKTFLVILSGGVSLGLLLRYAPFLFYGNWNPPVPAYEAWGTIIPVLFSLAVAVAQSFYKRHKQKSSV